jgi:Uma2 family endonuclease
MRNEVMDEDAVSVMTVSVPRTLRRAEWILKAPPPRLTSAEFEVFCAQNPDLRLEMTAEGEIIVMDLVGAMDSHRNFLLTGSFGVWSKADGSGVGFSSSAGFTLPNGAVRSPDLSWVRKERWEALTREEKDSFSPFCPDFVVELRPRDDRLALLQEKMEEYVENGAQLGWLIDPKEKKVHVYRPDAPVEILDNPPEISGEPLLKGFTLKLEGIID